MNARIEKLYKEIGQYIVNALSVEWSLAWIEAEIEPGVAIMQGLYISQEGSSPVSFDVDEEAMDAFEELQRLMEKQLNRSWRKACFELNSNGKFDLKFEY